MSKRIGPTDKHVWKVAMHLQHNLFWVSHKHISLPLGPIQPSSPSTKELHDLPCTVRRCRLSRMHPRSAKS